MAASAPKRAANTPQPQDITTHHLPATLNKVTVASGNVPIATEIIAALAYSFWEARGCQGGSAEEDWLLAEQQLRAGS